MEVPPISFFLLLFFFPGHASAADPRFHTCGTANYTEAFVANLDRALAFLNTSTPQTGFNTTTTTGDGNDQATALAQCRGDIGRSDCQSCVSDAVDKIHNSCPYQTDAVVWFDNCFLRYSNTSFLTIANNNFNFIIKINADVVDPATFNNRLGSLLDDLSSKAAAASSRYAAGKSRLSDFQSVYGLVECTRDLIGDDCKRCLVAVISTIQSCCAGKRYAFIGSPSCTVRFSLDPIYNLTAMMMEAAPPPPVVVEAAPPPPSLPVSQEILPDSGGGGNKSLVIGISIGTLVVAFFVGVCLWVAVKREKVKGWKRWEMRGAGKEVEESESGEESSFLFELKSMENATDGFSNSNRLGQGGFGTVYKGKLPNGKAIAVKKLSVGSEQGVQQFMNEVKLLVKLQHRNLVMLLGCCIDGGEKMLVYEYLPNKSLDNYLFSKRKSILLDWPKRFNIIMGIARGLLYLHQESKLTIIHRDIKASNILLDEQMEPKISDFGLARLFPGEVTHANTRTIAGTYGYMAPEYARRGLLSAKCDVYSFGVLLLEILSGRKNFNEQLEEEKQELICHAWRLKREGKLIELMDPCIGSCPQDVILKCSEIGLLCCEANVESRPSMASVLIMLSNNSTTVPRPRNPGFGSTRNTRRHSRERSSIPSRLGNRSNHVSMNYMSTSDFDGR